MSEISQDGTVELDLSGLKCPLPALRTRKALRALAPGARLAVTATDPLAGIDIPNVVREEGAALEALESHVIDPSEEQSATARPRAS